MNLTAMNRGSLRQLLGNKVESTHHSIPGQNKWKGKAGCKSQISDTLIMLYIHARDALADYGGGEINFGHVVTCPRCPTSGSNKSN